ncbi:MAG: serine/threonine protein kinase [Magnetococcus sp. YQC-3]
MCTPSVTQPTQLGKYSIVKVVDQGATALVYEGWDPDRQRRVAIKTLHPARLAEPDGERLLERLRGEARLCGALLHPNIVTLYEQGEEQNIPFLVLELLEGKTLREHLEAGDRFTTEHIVEIFHQILDALAYMHDRGVLHLDLKPANIFLLAGHRVKVTDFGIALAGGWQQAQHAVIKGTPGYMSPEQLMGQGLDRRSDLFSAGVILYELLTGTQPFLGRQLSTVMQRVLNLTPEPPSRYNSHLSAAMDAVLRRAMAKQPTERFSDAPSFRLALRQASEGAASCAR